MMVAALVPYYKDILMGNTTLQRAAMFIFAVLSAIAFIGQYAEGATDSLLFAGVLLVNQLLLFILSFKYGAGGFTRTDKAALLLSGFILLAWYFTKSAVLALILVVFVNSIAKLLITMKVYEKPYSDIAVAWFLSCIASVFGALAVGGWDWVLLLVPVHNAVTVGIIGLTIVIRRTQLDPPKSQAKVKTAIY
jgi:hypothetical protein